MPEEKEKSVIPGLKEQIAKDEFKDWDDDRLLRSIQDPPLLNLETPSPAALRWCAVVHEFTRRKFPD
jgi:hypothetical protein